LVSAQACVPPDVVAFPASTAEVSALLKLCHERRTPVVPFGVGTSLEGHVQAPRGGLSIDVGAKMTAMLEENAGDMDCRAEAGATRKAVNAALRHTGLEFMVDPGADATVGGMAACGASGTTAVRYGTMRDAVLGLTVVLGAGQESEIPNFKGSVLGRFPLVSADFWTSDHLSERPRSVNAFPGTRARGTLMLKRR
jgi:D-lactate dehydrogenase (cytochrome)